MNDTEANDGTTTTTLNILGPTTTPSSTNDTTVLYMVEATPNSAAGAKSAIAEKAGFLITPSTGSNNFGAIQFTYAGTAYLILQSMVELLLHLMVLTRTMT